MSAYINNLLEEGSNDELLEWLKSNLIDAGTLAQEFLMRPDNRIQTREKVSQTLITLDQLVKELQWIPKPRRAEPRWPY